jgi:hypothetical protein
MNVFCALCGEQIDTNSRLVFRKVTGWEQKRSQGGANVIHLREEIDVWACDTCINRRKRGIDPAQGSFV